MEDPSRGISQQLLPHLHLKSSWTYPFAQQPLPLEHILDQLLKASQIVQTQPFAWTYLSPPNDGTLILTWRPPSATGRPFASDGIVWAGAETVARNEVQGYTLEISVHASGFIPGVDQFTTRRRMRYRIIGSNNNAPFDPNLELVQWIASSPDARIPSRMVSIQAMQQNQVRERRYLESQGPLPRKDFMLNDRSNWPTINLPGTIPGNPYQNAAQGRPGMPAFNRTPSATRQLVPQAGAMIPGMQGAMAGIKTGQPGGPLAPFLNLADDILENERNTEFGDMLDFLNPRDISIARFKQHHEWMEEIMSTPYDMRQIVPVDLGLKLSGSLKDLTEGLWEDGTALAVEGAASNDSAKKVDPARLKAFEEKMAKHLSDGEQELLEMQRQHAEKVEEIKQQRLFANLERKLAQNSRDGSLVGSDEIIREAEQALGGKLNSKPDIRMVQRGGLLNKGEENVGIAAQQQQQQQPQPPEEDFNADFGNLDTAGEALDFFNQDIDYPT